jgi:hypothetical protein
MKKWILSFVAGFVSTLVFHQGVLHLLHLAGVFPRAAWNMAPVPPFGVPSVLSLAFWGGVWGPVLWALILFVVMPLKGMPMAGGFDPKLIAGALLLNGAWGLGVVGLMRLYGQR